MPSRRLPSYRLHKPSGRGVVTLNGRDVYLGAYDSPESRLEYDRLIAEWLAGGRVAKPRATVDLTVAEAMLPYLSYARRYYQKDGQPTSQVWLVERSLKRLTALYGHTPAQTFGPLKLKALRHAMIGEGLARGYINQTAGVIRLAFAWCVSEELLPPTVSQALETVANLHKGRSGAAEPSPIVPVEPTAVDATLPFCHRILAAMLRVQRYSGMRPGEVCSMRRSELSLSPNERLQVGGRTLAAIDIGGIVVGLYAPRTHKTAHHEKARVIVLGPRALDALRPFLDRPPAANLFSPREACTEILEAAGRQVRWSKRRRPPGDRYTANQYGKALSEAIRRANRHGVDVPHWHPNQLRHATATLVHEQWDIHAAAAVLGHAKADTTLVYAEQAILKAAAVMAKVG